MAVATARNAYIDFFRGLALWWIFIDHTPGNWLSKATFSRFGVCDAFELFVLLAGFSASYAYGPVLFQRGWRAAAGKILRRCGTIYLANLALFAFLCVEAAFLVRSPVGQSVLGLTGLDPLKTFSASEIGTLLTFNYPAGLLNILPLYILLFLGFAAVLPLLRFPRTLLALSIGLYATTYLLGLHIPGMPIGGETAKPFYFNPLAWQILLVTGAILVTEPAMRPKPDPVLDTAAVAVLLVAFGVQISIYLSRHGYIGGTSPVLIWMQGAVTIESAKIGLHPLRLVNIFAWAWLAYRLAPLYGSWVGRPWARPLILCGRQSLPVFCAGTVLAPLGGFWLATLPGPASQAAYNLIGAAIMVSVAALAAARRSRRRGHPDQGCGPQGAACSSFTSCDITSGRNLEANPSTKSTFANTAAQCARRSASSSNFHI